MRIDDRLHTRERKFLLKQLDRKFKGAFLAGGALTSTFTNSPIQDFDLYFKSKAAFLDALVDAYDYRYWCVSLTSRSITFMKPNQTIQLMHFGFFPTADDIFASFDFTCCMAALDLDDESLHFHDDFLSDTSKRELVFNHGTAFPIASGIRVAKYQDKGFSIRKLQWLKILVACNFKQIGNWDQLQEQLGGSYGDVVKLASDKPYCLDSAIEALETARTDSCSEQDIPTNSDEALDVFDPVTALPTTANEAAAQIFKAA